MSPQPDPDHDISTALPASTPGVFNLQEAENSVMRRQWREAVSGLNSIPVACFRVPDSVDRPSQEYVPAMLDELLHSVFCQNEQNQWAALKGIQRRRIEWLLARVAAKEAVADLLSRCCGLHPEPAEIEIHTDEFGRPSAMGWWIREIDRVPCVSLSHTRGMGAALTAWQQTGCGIDIEVLGGSKKKVQRLVLDTDECAVAGDRLTQPDDEWLLRLWCAKEAVGKALGRGLPAGPGDLKVRMIDSLTGSVMLTAQGRLAEIFPHLRGVLLASSTFREGVLIGAAALYAHIESTTR